MALVTAELIGKINDMGLAGETVAMGYYKTLFDMVCDPKDWKAPIDRTFHSSLLDCDLEVLRHAILCHTGNPDLKIEVLDTYIHVTSAGYRAGPAGP